MRPTACLLATALVAACGDPAGSDGVDAGPTLDAALADADLARTDLVPAVGSAATLDVATWNLREFPAQPDSPRLLADLIASLDLDLVAVEEITDRDALAAVVARLPGWASALPTDEGSTTGGLGLLWRTSAVTPATASLEHDADGRFPRPVVRVAVTVTGAAVPTPVVLRVVHLKAGTSASDEQARVTQMTAIEADVRVDGDAGARVLVLGDFNTDSGDARAAEVFAPWTGAPARYQAPSLPLDQAGVVTFLPASIMLDHMVATRSLDAAITEPPLVPPLDQQLPGYQAMLSDHLPLVLRLRP